MTPPNATPENAPGSNPGHAPDTGGQAKADTSGQEDQRTARELEADRRRKLQRLRDELGIDPFGQRIDGLISLPEARARYDQQADEEHKADATQDQRPVVAVAGRIVQHRVMGNLIFISLRDADGDLQIAVSKKAVTPEAFKQAKLADLSDIAVARGPLGTTKTGEITVWAKQDSEQAAGDSGQSSSTAGGFQIATKSLAPPPGKWHGLQDAEQRYRKRYVDLYANPQVMRTMLLRSTLVKATRDFLTATDAQVAKIAGGPFVEVETPMMQPIPGGAAARPFMTHHNALDIDLYLRIAPELYLKRLLVGGMPRVFEINRNFRNEGVSPRHNPEFTMLELYQAFGDYQSMMAITESLLHHLATEIIGRETLPFGDHLIDYNVPFQRATYHQLFEQYNGFPASDRERLLEKAQTSGIETANKHDDLILQEVWEQTVENHLIQPTFVYDYPASLCPLTKAKADKPDIAERFELYIAGMEIANAYTELNDPQVQEDKFRQQIKGLDDEEATFRNVDEDFLEALRVGMPPAGGLGIGIDRAIMLLTNQRSIRDVILFPLMRPKT